ncbi:MAG: hypothetical protein A3I05_04455 [Deltaproteobacteria bacterium RIFCSPLOWO2_02_FULL_44_10]|nr:MAG: hypothetical protein A3C46_07260 [Deltaproteobacteria bacterium RIFCSPHIGHO2_02_FULL_44_16]OGQ46609.1 MAG: hypothetical protein A3I05_04455 [Deltaproteobacteria bacterium RIFCSPLOWO2_02_FULL_44_10]
MILYLFLAFLFFLLVLLLVNYFQDRRYLKKKVSETMRGEIRKELDEELETLKRRQEKFRKTLEQVQKRN